MKWPVNPAHDGEGIAKVASESVIAVGSKLSTLSSPRSSVPSLLHVYWFLHGLHLLLGGIALGSWWRKPTLSTLNAQLSTAASSSLRDRLWPLIPWLCLALIFWIPGVYLEFPSDPWEHYKRINAWHLFNTVTESTGWSKSSYFLGYSFIGKLAPDRQQVYLDIYYTAMSLLLCWQYYRLAKAVGLGNRASSIFVLFQALAFGNNIFGFYRYYGIASTVPALLAAVALVRLGLKFVSVCHLWRATEWNGTLLASLLSSGLLIALMACNHLQALGIALLGLGAVAVWRLLEWRRTYLVWLLGSVLFASLVLVEFWPMSPPLREIYRPAGWMTPWYGFNLLSASAPAAQRSLQVLGLFGLVNVIAGACLLRRNHVVGWLTVFPILALVCPLFAVPFAEALVRTSLDNIVMFPRMLLGIPAGLALTVLLQTWARSNSSGNLRAISFVISIALLLALTATPAGSPFYNRFWHALERPSADLSLRHVISALSTSEQLKLRDPVEQHFLTTPGIGFAVSATGVRWVTFDERLIGYPQPLTSVAAGQRAQTFLGSAYKRRMRVFIPSPLSIYSYASQTATLSQHWLPQEVALQNSDTSKMEILAIQLGGIPLYVDGGTFYLFGQ